MLGPLLAIGLMWATSNDIPKVFWFAVIPAILAVLLLRSFLVEPFRIPSGSMMPTLLVGDFILVNKYTYGLRLPVLNTKIVELGEPERGDVVVFRYPKDPSVDYIKRVVGVPGDTVGYFDKVVYINGEPAGQVPAGVAVLGAEGGPEGVDPRQGLAVGLHVELAAHRQEGLLAEEVLAVVHFAAFKGRIFQIEGRYSEQLTGPFAIAGGDDGRMDIKEAALLKELVHSKGQGTAHPGHGTQAVGAGPQVGDGAQELQIQRCQYPVVDDVAQHGRQGQYKGGGSAHADGGLHFARNPHERAQTKKFHQHDIVDKYRADQDEQVFGHAWDYTGEAALCLPCEAYGF